MFIRRACGLGAWTALLACGLSAYRAAADDVTDPPPACGGRGTLPLPKADDRTFVLDVNMDCTFHSTVTFNVPVTRYLGETDAQGHLLHAHEMVAQGVLDPYAILAMPAYDVDYYCEAYWTPPCERDRVWFNGEVVNALHSGNSEYLQGANNVWRSNQFLIPIEKVKFPGARGQNGQPPTPRMNQVRIDIDVLNNEWCTAIDWISLSIKCMSPIILIHGNGSNGAFFERQDFTGGLSIWRLLWDNSVSLPADGRAANGRRLDEQIPPIVRSFGVDSVHLVAHSKGGLDAREYLEVYQPARDQQFKVLSYTSLSTPHNGSILADITVTRQDMAKGAAVVEFPGFPYMANALAYLASGDPGHPDLQTSTCAAFNKVNIARLPAGAAYYAVAADADTNGNATIDIQPDEYRELRVESATLRALPMADSRTVVDTLYESLRHVRHVYVDYEERQLLGSKYLVAKLETIPNPQPMGNDCMVTIPSGLGAETFARKTAASLSLTGQLGRNHASIANVGVANWVVPRVIEVEATNGDLK